MVFIVAFWMRCGEISFVVYAFPVQQAFEGPLALRGKLPHELVVDCITVLWHLLAAKMAHPFVAHINFPAYLRPWGWLFLRADVVWHENPLELKFKRLCYSRVLQLLMIPVY